MNKKNFFLLIAVSFQINAFCQYYHLPEKKAFNKDSITAFTLQSVNGADTHLSLAEKKILVIAFLSPECPLCKNYSSKLANIKNKYGRQVRFAGIIPGSFDINDITSFHKNYLPSWELLRDTSLLLTHYLEGEVTPEVLVINNKDGLLIYKGAIDNWLVSLGKARNKVTNYYLDVALNNFINNNPSIPFTKPVGCLINDF